MRFTIIASFLLIYSNVCLQPSFANCEKALEGKPEIEIFPNPKNVSFDSAGQGLVTDQVALAPKAILEAYSKGIFPWVDHGETAGWYVLQNRGILDFSELHIPKSLKKDMKKSMFKITFDQAFEDVIRNCATAKRPEQEGTWIADKFIKSYTELHQQGHAHSVEVWLDGVLVGGLYGVHVKGVFSGESMFHKVSGASKFALLALIDHLKSRNIQWMDTQQVSEFPRQLGGKTIPHLDFLERLEKQHQNPISFFESK